MDKYGYVFLDKNGAAFEYVLDYLRTDNLEYPEDLILTKKVKQLFKDMNLVTEKIKSKNVEKVKKPKEVYKWQTALTEIKIILPTLSDEIIRYCLEKHKGKVDEVADILFDPGEVHKIKTILAQG